MTTLPPISALFLTHFDDIKGQTTTYFQSADADISADGIEHIALPSGLHLLESDLVAFTHCRYPGVGLFRNRPVEEGRGRRMGTLGVIISSDLPEDLFELKPALEELYDQLEAAGNPFEGDIAKTLLDAVWAESRSDVLADAEGKSRAKGKGKGDRAQMVRTLVEGRGTVSANHPIAYLPSLLAILGPLIIPVYKAALTGKRILLYSQPPLLPVGAFAWCIAAMALAPASIGGTGIWLGNVGLMELGSLKERRGGWVANAIYRAHAVYDLFLDLSTTPPTLSPPSPPTSSRPKHHRSPTGTSYHLSDLPLYRSLLLLDASPPSISLTHGPSLHSVSYTQSSTGRHLYTGPGGWWLLAFDVISGLWSLCVGVCEYAVGRGRAGMGDIHLDEEDGDEDARALLIPRDLEDIEEDEDVGMISGGDGEEEDGAVRRGRLILRQLYHSTFHLHARLVQVVESGRGGGIRRELGDKEVKELAGTKLYVSADEARFWQDLAAEWGFTAGTDDEQD